MAKTNYQSIDEFHNAFSGITLERMEIIRRLVHESAPEVKEVISYQIPAFRLGQKDFFIYYSGYANHVSISHPWSKDLLAEFAKELSEYKVSKAAIQFPNNKPLPTELIKKILAFRKEEILSLNS